MGFTPSSIRLQILLIVRWTRTVSDGGIWTEYPVRRDGILGIFTIVILEGLLVPYLTTSSLKFGLLKQPCLLLDHCVSCGHSRKEVITGSAAHTTAGLQSSVCCALDLSPTLACDILSCLPQNRDRGSVCFCYVIHIMLWLDMTWWSASLPYGSSGIIEIRFSILCS